MIKKKKIALFSAVSLSLILCLYQTSTNVLAIGWSNIPTISKDLTVPPEGFNPLTASSEELKNYGFPEKPTDPNELSKWESAMKNAKHYVKPEQTVSSAVHSTSTAYTCNWAGYVVQQNNNLYNGYTPKYYDVSAYWTQPSYSGSADPSFWVGIGGYVGSGNLVQAGADSNASSAGGSSRYEFWVEDYPLGTVWEKSPSVNAGNQLYTDVTYKGSTSTAFLENVTTGQYTTVSFNTPYYDGTSADFIHEAVGGAYGSWGTTTFSSCDLKWKVSTGASGAGEASAYNNVRVIMTNNGTSTGSWEADPSSSITNGSFSVSSY